MEDPEGVTIPEGAGGDLGEAMSSSMISFPSPPRPMGIDQRSPSIDGTLKTSLKADSLVDTGYRM